MDQKLIDFNKSLRTKKIPDIKPGDIIRVHKKIIEGEKERIQVFKGLVIAIKGKQSSSPTITIRRESQGVGLEMTVPIYLPTIEKIEVLRHSKVRRSKLYYMRERSGKATKMKAKDLTKEEKEEENGSSFPKDLEKNENSSKDVFSKMSKNDSSKNPKIENELKKEK